MPRTIDVTVPPEKTNALLDRLTGAEHVISVSLQRGGSIDPPGDVVTIRATNDGTRSVLATLEELEVTRGGSFSTSEIRSLIAKPHQHGLDRESHETIWDEMAFLMRRESNISFDFLALMALSGGVAAAGLWTDTLHVVVGAMLFAPGFEPLVRIVLGLTGGQRALASRGLLASFAGYLTIALGAVTITLLLRLIDSEGAARPLHSRQWVGYWSTIQPSTIVISALAGLAGAFTTTSLRAVLATGVMVALALIPTMALAGMAIVEGDLSLLGKALGRWSLDVVLILSASALVLGIKYRSRYRRRALS